MELLSVFFALAAIVLLYFSNRLYVKKSVIGYRPHMALLPRSQFDELLRNDRLACGGIVCQGMDWFSLACLCCRDISSVCFQKDKKTQTLLRHRIAG